MNVQREKPETYGMNPNSGNQRWSRWTFTITPGPTKKPNFATLKENAARFGRKAFGSASQMRVELWSSGQVLIIVRTEGHPVHDPAFVNYMVENWQKWAIGGWGPGTTLECVTKLEAGSRQDGTPADQLIIAPPVALETKLYDKISRSPVSWLRAIFTRATVGSGDE